MSCWPRETNNSWLTDCKSRLKAQNDLRAKVASTSSFDESSLRTLDSALKKTTAFMKKMKTLNATAVPSLISDLSKLNLSKFVEEMAQAISETKLKSNEIPAVVDLCAEITIRYQKFPELLLIELKKCVPTKKTDKVTNPAKLRVDLRFLCELFLAGIVQKEGLQVLGAAMTYLTATDKSDLFNIGLMCSVLKSIGWQLAGLVPLPDGDGDLVVTISEKDLDPGPITENHKKVFRDLFVDYFNTIISKLEKECAAMNVVQKRVKRQERTRGDASVEDKAALEDARNEYEKLKGQASEFSQVLGVPLKDMKEEPSDDEEDELAALEMGKALAEGEVSMWPDTETQAFYSNLINIRDIVPKNLYKESEESTIRLNAMETCIDSIDVEELEKHDEGLDDVSEVIEEAPFVEPSVVEEPTGETVEDIKSNMADFLDQLNVLVNRDVTDTCALNFVQHLNSKGNRKRLVKTLIGTPGNRLDLIPFYGRLLATLAPVMPDVITEVTNSLLNQLRTYMIYRESKVSVVRLEEKLKVCIFISELVKFEVVPRAEALSCLRQLVYDFKGHCIDMACTMIETVGFYLYRHSDSHPKMKILLNVMLKKKDRLKDPRHLMLVDNCFYACVPTTDGNTKNVPTLPPMKLFIKQIILNLNQNNVTRSLKLLRRIDWSNSEYADWAIRYLSSPWLVPYMNLPQLASVVAGMVALPAHDWIIIQVIDCICETIRLSLEVPGPFNQQAMTCVTYLGELYNYNGCENGIIFKILYQLVSFPEFDGDSWNDFYRLRMICEMLNVVGEFFKSGANKKKMDYFLVCFYRYYWIKRDQWEENVNSDDSEHIKFPPDVEAEFRNCIKFIRKGAVIPNSFEEADKLQAEKATEAWEQQKLKDKMDFSDLMEGDDEEDSRRERPDRSLHQIEEEDEYDEEAISEAAPQASNVNNPPPIQPEDEEFIREFERLMNETHRNAPTQAPSAIPDMSVPVQARQKLKGISFADEGPRENQNANKPNKVALLARGKGNKVLLKSVAIDEEKLHHAWKAEKERQQKELEDIKRVTLGHTARIMAEEEQEALQNLQFRRNQGLRYKK